MILKKELIQIGLDCPDADSALREVARAFVDNGFATEGYPQAIIDREQVYPTALPGAAFDIAMPHCDAKYINKTGVAVITLKNPVEMKMMGDPDTTLHPKMFFMLGIADPHGQVEMLQRLIAVIQDADLLNQAYACQDVDALYDLMAPKLGD